MFYFLILRKTKCCALFDNFKVLFVFDVIPGGGYLITTNRLYYSINCLVQLLYTCLIWLTSLKSLKVTFSWVQV